MTETKKLIKAHTRQLKELLDQRDRLQAIISDMIDELATGKRPKNVREQPRGPMDLNRCMTCSVMMTEQIKALTREVDHLRSQSPDDVVPIMQIVRATAVSA